MLQQTTVATVGRYFGDFMTRWPTVGDLAAAPLDSVLHAWAGLGYYARARNLHACAKAVVERHGGRFPETEAELRTLPGIGDYTAAAIAAIAFDRPAAVMDGNVERVMARLFRVAAPLPDAKPALRAHAASLTPTERPGDYAQAVMDLGAAICTPRRPRCVLCPWVADCAARRAGDPELYPMRRAKPERPVRRGVAFWITRADGAVLLRRRPERGLLGGMMEIPSTPWDGAPWPDPLKAAALAPLPASGWKALPGSVGHTFTHFHLELSLIAGQGDGDVVDGVWSPPARLHEHALPTLMRKVARFALAGLAG